MNGFLETLASAKSSRRFCAVIAVSLAATGALAQSGDQTLADIRQDLTVLNVEVQGLRRELSTTSAPDVPNLQGTSVLQRIDAIEAELQRLTAATEALDNRVNRIVQDGTNRIGDLEFRLIELEGGDISTVGTTLPLGGGEDLPPAPAPATESGAELAVGEQIDFDRAREAYDAGSYETAAIQFGTFTETYTTGPLTAEAHFWRGRSLSALGDVSGAARAYLQSFSGDPASAIAPQSLLQLGLALDALGQMEEACVMLGEVTNRFPASDTSIEAQTARADMGCL
ncbi:MAG: tol-pal system protein YbgF [Pseudomonadota bacterium]